MQDNNITHRFYVPLGYTFSWVLGNCLGGDSLISLDIRTSLWRITLTCCYFIVPSLFISHFC